MREAREGFDQALASFVFSDPSLPVYSNVTGKRISAGAEARALCGKQLVSTVQWVAVEESLLADGFDRLFEAGPGTVLSGLMRALRPDQRCLPAGTLEAIVTGGFRGIGNAIVQEFLREGATVHSLSRNPADNQAALEALARESGGSLHWRAVDVTKEEEITRAVDAIAAEGVDILGNNAGITRDGLIFRMPAPCSSRGA
jgi:acyl transferase domain-containing protein